VVKPAPFERCPDLRVNSADGRLCLSQTTPPAATGSPKREAKIWSLVEVTTGRVLWHSEHVSASPGALGAYLHTDGWAAVHLQDDSIVLLDPYGRSTSPIDVLEALRCTDSRTDHLTQWKMAHEPCDGCPKAFFFEDAGRVFFVFRTWWGATLLFDMMTAARVPVTPERRPQLQAAAEAWALARLSEAARGRAALEEGAQIRLREACAAAQLAGQMKLEQAAPLLERIEPLPPGGFRGYARLLTADASAPLGPFRSPSARGVPKSVRVHPRTLDALRLDVQLALLRLGRAPAGHAGYAFPSASDPGLWVEPDPRPGDWLDNLSSITPGMSPFEVLVRIGAPSHVPSRYGAAADDPWEYEHREADGSARTLQIRWKGDVVRHVEQLPEPGWPRAGLRDARR